MWVSATLDPRMRVGKAYLTPHLVQKLVQTPAILRWSFVWVVVVWASILYVQDVFGTMLYVQDGGSMTGRPQGPEARTEVLQVRFTPTGMRTLDEMRGSTTRSAFVRRLIAREYGTWKK